MAAHRESVLLRIDCDPPAFMWSGLGNLYIPADGVLAVGSVALGGGELISVPDFQQLIGGTVERLDFTVSGVDEDTTRLAFEDAPSVRGARVDVATVEFDSDWQVVAVNWEQVFEARSLTISRPQSDGDSPPTRSVTLTIVQGPSTRGRANISMFTDADQRRRSSDDAIFSNVAGINTGTSRRWGPDT